MNDQAAANTDKLLWRENEDGYSPSIHLTEGGGIGITVGGYCIVKPLKDWHALASTTKAEGGGIEKFVGRRDAAESEQNKAGTTSDEGKSNVLRSEADDQSPSLSNERPTPKPPKPSVQGPEEPLGMRHWWEQYWAENRSGKAPTGDIGCGEAFLFASWFAAQAREFEADYARANSPSPAITEKAVEDIATRINGCWALHVDTGTFARPTEKVIAKFLADRLREAGVRVE